MFIFIFHRLFSHRLLGYGFTIILEPFCEIICKIQAETLFHSNIESVLCELARDCQNCFTRIIKSCNFFFSRQSPRGTVTHRVLMIFYVPRVSFIHELFQCAFFFRFHSKINRFYIVGAFLVKHFSYEQLKCVV